MNCFVIMSVIRVNIGQLRLFHSNDTCRWRLLRLYPTFRYILFRIMLSKRRPYSAYASTARSSHHSDSVIIATPYAEPTRYQKLAMAHCQNENSVLYESEVCTKGTRPATAGRHQRSFSMSEEASRHRNLNTKLKTYRLNHHQAYTGIRNDVIHTFAPSDNKMYKEIKELNSSLTPEHSKALEKMLEKYCIKSKYNKNSLWAMPVNVEYITKQYVRNKGVSRQQLQTKRLIKQDIGKVSSQVDEQTDPHRKENRPFFQVNGNNIRKFEEKASRLGVHSRTHPIISIFDDKSSEVIAQYKQEQQLFEGSALSIFDDYPNEKIDNEEVQNERLQNTKLLKDLRRSINELRTKRKQAPKKPFTTNLC